MKAFYFLAVMFFYNTVCRSQSIIAGQHSVSDSLVNIVPDTLLNQHQYQQDINNYSLDINSDCIIDFELHIFLFGSPNSTHFKNYILPKNKNQISLGIIDSCYGNSIISACNSLKKTQMARVYNDNELIDGNSNWTDTAILFTYYDAQNQPIDSLGNPCKECFGNAFVDSLPHYLGVKVFTDYDTLYGWIKLEDVDSYKFTLDEYACNIGHTTCNTGIDNIETGGILKVIFPNPTTDKLFVTFNSNETSKIIFYDLTSKKIMEREFINSIELDFVGLAKGFYLYELISEHFYSVGKIIKN